MQSFQTSLYPHSEYDLRTTPTCDQVSGKTMENENGNLFMSGEEKWQIALSIKKGSYLSLNAVTNEQHLKGAIARALLWRGKKGNIWGSMKRRLHIFEFTLELQRRINTLEKGPAKGWWEPQWSSWGLLPAWFSERGVHLNVNQASEHQEHSNQRDKSTLHLEGLSQDALGPKHEKTFKEGIWIMRRSEKLSNRMEEAQKGRDN